jgi:hypothetical protein
MGRVESMAAGEDRLSLDPAPRHVAALYYRAKRVRFFE